MIVAMTVVKRGDELGEEYRRRITEVYVRSFADDFVAFSSDTGTLADAFEHMLLLEQFYIALLDGEPAGLASLTEGDQTLFAPHWHELRRHLGLVRGLLAYVVIRRWFMRTADEARPGRGEIGFVATEPAYRVAVSRQRCCAICWRCPVIASTCLRTSRTPTPPLSPSTPSSASRRTSVGGCALPDAPASPNSYR